MGFSKTHRMPAGDVNDMGFKYKRSRTPSGRGRIGFPPKYPSSDGAMDSREKLRFAGNFANGRYPKPTPR